jgi:alpha-methylacyl-CoA racemase
MKPRTANIWLWADDGELDAQMDFTAWPALKERVAAAFRLRTRDEWCAIFDGTDACVSPVLSMRDAPLHPHNAARGTFVEASGVVQPAPAPRYSATPTRAPVMATGDTGADTGAVLGELGYDTEKIAALKSARIIG